MARIVFSSLADVDFDGILADLSASAGYLVAFKYNSLFERLYDRLTDYPNSGAPRPALGNNIRIAMVSPFVIIYHHAEGSDILNVLRIVDGRRKISGSLLPRGHK